MNIVLQVFLIVSVLIFLAGIIHYLVRSKLNLKYSLVWLGAGIGMLVLAVFPQLVTIIGGWIGIAAPVNTVFLFAGMFMLLIIFTLTIIVSHMNNRIYRLTQMQAILEKRVRELENACDISVSSHSIENNSSVNGKSDNNNILFIGQHK